MARKRLIAPEFFKHPELYNAEKATGLPLRVAFAGLWTQADRRGYFAWKPQQLKLDVLPYDSVDMEAVLTALCQHGFVTVFARDGHQFGTVPTLPKWQTFHINEKPNPHIPEPLAKMNGADPVVAPEQHSASTPVAVTVAVAVTGTGTKKEEKEEKEIGRHRERAPEAAPLRSASLGAPSLAAIPFKPPAVRHDPERIEDILPRSIDTIFRPTHTSRDPDFNA